jgi:hypothetical protein
MSDNVVPLRRYVSDEDHAPLRRFLDLVSEAASETGMLCYVVATIHEPAGQTPCLHADGTLMSDPGLGVSYRGCAEQLLECAREYTDGLIKDAETGGE